MRALFERYLLHRKPGLAASSFENERRGVERFARFCQERGLAVEDLDWDWLASYRHQLPALSTAFLSSAIMVARRFCVWAYEEGALLADLSVFPVPRVRNRLPRVPSLAVMQRLLKAPDTSTPLGLRNRLILELLYGLGLRRAECCRLSLDHLNLSRETIRIKGKGGRERILPLGARLQRVCLAYLREARPRLAKEAGQAALLLSRWGRRLSHGALHLAVKTASQAIGIQVRAHQLRHACATHMIEAGAQYRFVQEFLGHRCLSSTRRYTRISPRQLREEFFRCHPRARHPVEEEPA